MAEGLFSNVYFNSRIDIEMLLCMKALSEYEQINDLIEKKSIIVVDDFNETLSAMYKKMPLYMKQELQYFFNNIELVYGLIGYEFEQENIGSIKKMIENIKEHTEADFLYNIVESYFYFNVSNEQVWLDIDKIRNNVGLMLEAVKKNDIKNKELQEKIIEILENHEEIKQRLFLLLFNFYIKIFNPVIDKIMLCLEQGKNKYHNLFEDNPNKFFDYYLKITNTNIKEKYEIHISYFSPICNLILNPHCRNSTCVVLGLFNDINMAYVSEKQKQILLNFYKALSDSTRYDILCSLNERPYYNQELAEKLKISPSTINHHISSMFELDIISMKRVEHRVYYELKKDVLKKMLQQSEKIFLGTVEGEIK